MIFILVVRLRQKSFQVFLEIQGYPLYLWHFAFGLSEIALIMQGLL